jgi:hypothetical protein
VWHLLSLQLQRLVLINVLIHEMGEAYSRISCNLKLI